MNCLNVSAMYQQKLYRDMELNEIVNLSGVTAGTNAQADLALWCLSQDPYLQLPPNQLKHLQVAEKTKPAAGPI